MPTVGVVRPQAALFQKYLLKEGSAAAWEEDKLAEGVPSALVVPGRVACSRGRGWRFPAPSALTAATPVGSLS